jgi:hypothetical protein
MNSEAHATTAPSIAFEGLEGSLRQCFCETPILLFAHACESRLGHWHILVRLSAPQSDQETNQRISFTGVNFSQDLSR